MSLSYEEFIKKYKQEIDIINKFKSEGFDNEGIYKAVQTIRLKRPWRKYGGRI